MITLAELPSLIISSILQRLIHSEILFGESKPNFSYLHICSLWRRLAINYCYDKVYYIAFPERSKKKTKSNFELINLLGYSKYVKWVRIRLYTSEQQVEFLNVYGSLFEADSSDWTKVNIFQYIYINDLSITSRTMYRGQIINVQEKIIEFTRFITQRLPQVKSLNLAFADITDASNIATHMFFEAYAKQITALSTKYTSCFHKSFFFNDLVNLALNINPDAEQLLPRLDYCKIRDMTLCNIPYTFKWNDLFADNSIAQFCFKSLRTLFLQFSDDHMDEELNEFIENMQLDSRDYRFKADFPEIRTMIIHGRPSWFISKRTKYQFSKKLKYLQLRSPVGALDLLKNVNFKQLEKCEFVCSDDEYLEKPDFYQIADKLFNVDCNFQYRLSSLRLYLDEYSIDWSQTHWINLQKIHLDVCSVDTLILINSHCPNLKMLQIEKLNVEMPTSRVESILKSKFLDRQHEASSGNIGLESLIIKKIESEVSDNQAIAAFICLYLMCCKSLIYLNIDRGEWMNIEAFVDQHKEEYPHLKKVVVKYAYILYMRGLM